MKKTILFLLILFFLSNTKNNLEKVKVEYPKPLVKGTEVPKSITNLEKPRKKNTAPKDVYIEKGCTNLSFEKDVTSSSPAIKGDLEDITDEDADGNNYVELKTGIQWIQIDLEKQYTIHALHIWHYHIQPRVYFDIIIKVSNDPDFIESVTTVFNNDDDNSSNFGKGDNKNYIEEFYGKTIKINPTKARYVRIYSNGNSSNNYNHYAEVLVFGK